jgi:predicted PurR-regulated permease PerM
VTLGLFAIGMPSALALGFLAGLSEFVPIVGPILSAIPALLLAFSEGGNMVFWVAGLYLLIQQLEGNVIMPLVQRKTVDLPPVVALFALVALGILFGPLGVLLGTPLTVVLYVAVNQLYVRDTLGEDAEIPGED